MTRALLCLALAVAPLCAGCGAGDDKAKLPDRTYKTPDADFDPNAKEKEKGNHASER
jgi:major membrane immunogen (membrane-anchored lipoprotein)